MRLDIFHLQARSAFHFGERGVGMEESSDHAPSDTLFSALCNTVRITDSVEALEAMLDEFLHRNPPFLLSGGFPYVPMGDGLLRFYPAPASLAALAISKELNQHKSIEALGKLSKIAWLSETLFLRWLDGNLTQSWLGANAVLLRTNHALVTVDEAAALSAQYGQRGEPLRLWDVDDVPRVAVDRITNASNVFQAGRLAFVAGGGLWCAACCLNWSVNDMYRVLGWMQDNGLGGERFSGYGQFTVLEETASLNVPAPAERPGFVTLSHYSPEPSERAVLGEQAAYALIPRRGWMYSPDGSNLRRPAVRMIAAGGVLHSLPDTDIYGRLANVTPSAFNRHRVWRYGYALGVGAFLA